MISLELKKLKESRALKVADMNKLVEVSKTETRDLTTEEIETYDGLDTELKTIEANIKILERQNELNAQSAETISTPNIKKETRPFSITKAIRQYVSGNLDGVESEVNAEGINEMRNAGISESIGLHMPLNSEVYQRSPLDVTVTVDGGASTVPTINSNSLIEALVGKTVLRQLGATEMLGLTGNIDLNRVKTPASATWEGEVDAAAASGLKFDKVALVPRRLAAKEYISYQLLQQSSIAVDRVVENEIIQAFARALDIDAFTKVITAGSEYTEATAGTVIWGDVVGLRTMVLAKDVVAEGAAYVARPEVYSKFETTAKDTGSGLFMIDGLGYPIVSTSLIDGTGGVSELIFGQFKDLILAQWGSLIITPDAITMADTGQWKITVNGYFDSEVKHNESFGYIAGVTH